MAHLVSSLLKNSPLCFRQVNALISTPFVLRPSAFLRQSLPIHALNMSSQAFQNHDVLLDIMQESYRKVSNTPLSIDQLWDQNHKAALEDAARQPPSNAFSGRSVSVSQPGSRASLSTALQTLDSILLRNKVRVSRHNERHEKKGAKRRRLSSERWRKQFANEVRKKVELVVRMRNRGA